jgi:hypothetical protein
MFLLSCTFSVKNCHCALDVLFLLPEQVTIQEGSLQREETSTWSLDTKFVMLSQKKNLRTHRGRDQEVY